MKIDQTRLDQELDFILGQQRELEDMLLPLEQSVNELSTVSTYQQHADIDREHTYVSLSVFVSLCMSVCVCLYVCLSVCLYLSVNELSTVSTYQQHAGIDWEHTYVLLSVFVSLCMSVCVCLYLSMSYQQLAHTSSTLTLTENTRMFCCLSIYLCIYLVICLSLSLCLCLWCKDHRVAALLSQVDATSFDRRLFLDLVLQRLLPDVCCVTGFCRGW